MSPRDQYQGMPTTNPDLIWAQNENQRLRLARACQQHRDHEQAELRRLERENAKLRRLFR